VASEQMKIFTRTFDFLTWLLPATNNFPRAHRHSFTQRLLDAAFDFQERIEEANRNDNLGFRVCASTFFSGILAGTAGRLLASWPRRKNGGAWSRPRPRPLVWPPLLLGEGWGEGG